jgi:hypothetical protein
MVWFLEDYRDDVVLVVPTDGLPLNGIVILPSGASRRGPLPGECEQQAWISVAGMRVKRPPPGSGHPPIVTGTRIRNDCALEVGTRYGL